MYSLMDPVDCAALAKIASMRAAVAIIMEPEPWGDEKGICKPYMAESLRHRAFLDISRTKKQIPSVYVDEKDMHALGLLGRRYSGVWSIDGIDFPEDELPGSLYQCTRSCFNAPKWYKELARPCSVRDFDMKKAFPTIILRRYPDLETIRYWRQQPEAFARECGVSVAVAKEFVSATAGSGRRMEQDWLDRHGIADIPELLAKYKREVSMAQSRDVQNFGPLLCPRLTKLGVSSENMRNRIFYIINTMEERVTIDDAIQRISGISTVVSYEHDGFAVVPAGMDTDDWEARVLELIGEDFAVKPYRSREQLIELLRHEFSFIAATDFTQNDPLWKDKELDQAKLVDMLKSGKCPTLLAKPVILDLRTKQGEHILSRWRATPGPHGKYDYWHFEERLCGGLWVEKCHMEAMPLIEEVITQALCRLLQCKLRDMPEAILKGGFSKAIAEKMGSQLLQSDWHDVCDAHLHLLQFSCGTVLDTTTMTTRRGTPDLCMTKCMGIAWPGEEFKRLENVELQVAESWLECLREAKDFENSQMGPYERYPQGKRTCLLYI